VLNREIRCQLKQSFAELGEWDRSAFVGLEKRGRRRWRPPEERERHGNGKMDLAVQ
jgi:hypothetical protein